MPPRFSDADWSERYLEGDIPWDKGYGAPPLKEALERRPVTGRALVPGCGLGHDVRLLAGQGAEVVGLDIATAAVEMARNIDPVGTETYEVGNFLNPDFAPASFDLVFEHTCFCAIFPDERSAYARAAHHVLKPGGHLLAIFFTNIDNPEGPPFQVAQSEIRALFGDLFDMVETWIPTQSYPEREGREEMWLLRKREDRLEV